MCVRAVVSAFASETEEFHTVWGLPDCLFGVVVFWCIISPRSNRSPACGFASAQKVFQDNRAGCETCTDKTAADNTHTILYFRPYNKQPPRRKHVVRNAHTTVAAADANEFSRRQMQCVRCGAASESRIAICSAHQVALFRGATLMRYNTL